MSKRVPGLCLLLPTLCLVALLTAASASGASFFDGTFVNTDWSTQVLLQGTGAGSQVGTGGNPGEFRQSNHNIVNSGESVFLAQLKTAAVYDPSIEGGIASIDLSLDLIFLGGSAGTSQVGYRVLIEQAGSLFVPVAIQWLPTALGPGGGLPGSGWTSFVVNGHTFTDFSRISGTGTLDFSVSGAPITFGFMTANSALANNFSTTSGIDNWSVTVHSVPPSVPSLSPLGIALLWSLLGLAGYRRLRA